MFRKILFGYLALFITSITFSQEILVKGYFQDDSLRIGVGTPYILTCQYPSYMDVVFPDSLYNFSPFELGNKWFATTRTTNGVSYDSAVYYLLSFEIDSTQYIQLPVFQLVGNDSIPIRTSRDSIFLQHLVSSIPDSVTVEAMPLIENTDYRYVNLALNYPYIAAGIILILLIAIIGFFVFGKSIKVWFRLRRLEKKHVQFIEKYNALVSGSETQDLTESIAYTWKKYLEQLESKPYTKMTTKELLSHGYMMRIEGTLKALDKAIYGKQKEAVGDAFNIMLEFSINRYKDKVNEIKHG